MENKKMSLLAGFAHLNRCLFQNDFRDKLIEMGMDEDNAQFLVSGMSENKGEGIVKIYQRVLQSIEPHQTEMTTILDRYVEDFAKKYDWDFSPFVRVFGIEEAVEAVSKINGSSTAPAPC